MTCRVGLDWFRYTLEVAPAALSDDDDAPELMATSADDVVTAAGVVDASAVASLVDMLDMD